LKAFILNGKSSMLVCLQKVEQFLALLQVEFTVRAVRLQCTSRSAAPAINPALHDVCNDLYHVLDHMEQQRAIAERRLVSAFYKMVEADAGVIQIFSCESRSTYTVNRTLATCSCRFYTIFLLPCCHHFYISTVMGDPTIIRAAIADRWLLSNIDLDMVTGIALICPT
jgi:hypothetical protein